MLMNTESTSPRRRAGLGLIKNRPFLIRRANAIQDGWGSPRMTRTVSRAISNSSSVGIAKASSVESVGGDFPFASHGLLISRGVQPEPGPLHALADLRADFGRVLSNAAGEDDCIGSTHAS